MPDKPDTPQAVEIPIPADGGPIEDVLGGAGPRGEVTGCPTGLADNEPVEVKKGTTSPGQEDATGQDNRPQEPQR